MNSEIKVEGSTEQFMNKCKKTITLIEYIFLGIYIIFSIYSAHRYYSYISFELGVIFILKNIIQITAIYFLLEGIKKGHKRLAFIPLIISLISLIKSRPLYILAGAYFFSGFSNLPLLLILSLVLQLFPIISMLYILLSKNIKIYCDYLKYNPSK